MHFQVGEKHNRIFNRLNIEKEHDGRYNKTGCSRFY